ncbi:YcaO-like family protein [Lichenifustis flavocetrariae]|uniref:YcaO-like family protein n=1 Tax=Lichenifustis flavocetrariae TaxID=2949735 RepID=A0AA41YQN9_9HYPH|nr:YcaO-like family protein [Lichenifustis flavocetrariae]MCW6506779.1 YcaO-like family protein [Lichenifustis flavocetrariae]
MKAASAPSTLPFGRDAVQKTYQRGTHRACSPNDTLARLKPLLPAFGITRVANLTGLDRVGLPVVAVFRPNARSSAVFHGKGIDLAAAKASGIMEAIETWHAENAVLPLMFGSTVDLRARFHLVDTEGLPRRTDLALSAHAPLLWAEGTDWMSEAATWVPFDLVHANFTVDGPFTTDVFSTDTNGLASGNTFWEAVSHGLCEIIERDATALWRASAADRQKAMRVDLAAVTDSLCLEVLDRFAQAGLDVAVWNMTTDVGVPAFQCLIKDASDRSGHIGSGAGCHSNRHVALLRALTEAAQVRMTYIAGSREDLNPDDYASATIRHRHQSVARMMEAGPGQRSIAGEADEIFETFEAEVRWLLDRLRGAGLREVVVVDLSRPDFDLSVVRVIVPFLEGSDHHRGSYVPGRRHRLQTSSS